MQEDLEESFTDHEGKILIANVYDAHGCAIESLSLCNVCQGLELASINF